MINNRIVGAKTEIVNILNGLGVPIAVSQLIINEVKQLIDEQVKEVVCKEIEEVQKSETKEVV